MNIGLKCGLIIIQGHRVRIFVGDKELAEGENVGITFNFVGTALDIKASHPTIMEVCPECEGGCFHMVCTGGMPYEVNCERCNGTGEVEVDD